MIIFNNIQLSIGPSGCVSQVDSPVVHTKHLPSSNGAGQVGHKLERPAPQIYDGQVIETKVGAIVRALSLASLSLSVPVHLG